MSMERPEPFFDDTKTISVGAGDARWYFDEPDDGLNINALDALEALEYERLRYDDLKRKTSGWAAAIGLERPQTPQSPGE